MTGATRERARAGARQGPAGAAVSVAWGLLSTARINRPSYSRARASPTGSHVVAVASRDAARAEAYAREHGIERAYGSYEALLEDPDVEAVYISLPNAMHVEWTLRALEAGKHVLCEKPFSRRPEEVERAFDLADSTGLVLSEGFMWRHHPQTQTLAALVAEGAIGRLRVVRAAFSFQLAAVHGADDTRFDPELDGGSLMDVGCYCVSAIRLLAGEPERVQGEQVRRRKRRRRRASPATLRCPDDVLAHFDCGFVLPYRGELEVVGEEASLFVDDPWHARTPGIELRRAGRGSSGSRSSPRTRTGSSSRTCARRDQGRGGRSCSGVTTRSARRARSTRSTAPPPGPSPSTCQPPRVKGAPHDLRARRRPLRADAATAARAAAAFSCRPSRSASGTTSATTIPCETSRAIVRRAFDLGITHFDLANNYGPPYGSAEENFGRHARARPAPRTATSSRSRPRPATTCGPGPYGEWGSRKYLLASLDQSLSRHGARLRRPLLLAPLRSRDTRSRRRWARSTPRCGRARRSTSASPPTRRRRPARRRRSCASSGRRA